MPFKEKIKKFNGTQNDWDKMALELRLSLAPEVYACKKCGYPVIEGYCCTHCQTSSPR